MPALDFQMIEQIGREIHPAHSSALSEDQTCPWTLFLTMALTLLKGVMPHVPRVLPMVISDPDMAEKAVATFESDEFKNNIEEYFVNNIKNDIQAPLNRQIMKSSETILQGVDLMNNLIDGFMGVNKIDSAASKSDKPRSITEDYAHTAGGYLAQAYQFAQTMYKLTR